MNILFISILLYFREHYQWNMDIWGCQSVQVEAELISILISTFKSLGLCIQDVVIKV